MSLQLSPYLMFGGRCREAMEYYRDVFGGELTMQTFGENHVPDVPSDLIMHAQLQCDSFTLFGADGQQGVTFEMGNGITLAFMGGADDLDRAKKIFDRLAADGKVGMAFEKQMWGDLYGELTDKYGVSWMLNVADPAEA